MPWKDTTSYSRSDNERIPTCWSIEASEGRAKLRVTVLKGHRFYPDDWVMHCHDLGITDHTLGKIESMTEDEAKLRAIAVVQASVNSLSLAAKSLSA